MPITYADKELYEDKPLIPTEKKFRYQDANEVKSVVNANETTLGTHVADVANPHAVTKSQVGLGNVPNLSFSGSNTGDQDLSGLQPLDSDLTAIAALTPANDDFIQRKSGVWTNRTIAQVKTDLGLGASWIDWSASLSAVGWSSTTVLRAYYRDTGSEIFFWVHISGTSNTTTVKIQLPVVPNALYGTDGLTIIGWGINGALVQDSLMGASGGSATATMYSTTGGGAWTSGVAKTIRYSFTYQK